MGYHPWFAGFLTCGPESGRGTLLGGQFDWGGRLLKCNGGAQRLAQLGWKPSNVSVSHGLGARRTKGGISTATPRRLASPLRSLPPILHIVRPTSMLSYSEGSRGLFVPLRVSGIFTASTISPSSWLRQCPDRYTIRAGRNLPDKEFRYLRTVIVTAAVYRGFDSMLLLRLHPLLTFRHRAGVRPYSSSFDFAKPCVFVKQSPEPFLCALRSRVPLSRSYGVNLPNSLAMIHSST